MWWDNSTSGGRSIGMFENVRVVCGLRVYEVAIEKVSRRSRRKVVRTLEFWSRSRTRQLLGYFSPRSFIETDARDFGGGWSLLRERKSVTAWNGETGKVPLTLRALRSKRWASMTDWCTLRRALMDTQGQRSGEKWKTSRCWSKLLKFHCTALKRFPMRHGGMNVSRRPLFSFGSTSHI